MEKFVIVESEYGPIKGIRKESFLGGDYVSFQAIPYMKAPVGKLKFRDPQPPEKWTEPLDATKEGSAFRSHNFFKNEPAGDLDAMFINVYTRIVDPKSPLPVMVHIHGGGFVSGSGGTELTGPDLFMQKNVVLVTMNYRLGIFGFLSLKDESLGVPGNAGLKDQTFALKWIKRNIQNFGGDPNNITIFGCSAGGGSVHYHMLSDHSKGLFNRVISMSGCAFNKSWSLTRNRDFTRRLAKTVGWDEVGGDKELLEFLENAEVDDIINATKDIFNDEEKYNLGLLIAFGPVVEPYVSENCFIPEDPVLMARNAWGNDIDLMIGACSIESLMTVLFADKIGLELSKVSECFTENLPRLLEIDPKSDKFNQYKKDIQKIYYGLTQPSEVNFYGFTHFLGDFNFWHGIFNSAKSHVASNGKGKTFVYRFDANLGLNLLNAMDPSALKCEGASHGDDVAYLFKTILTPPITIPSKEFDTVKRMLNIYVNFATTGNPNIDDGVTWEPLQNATDPVKVLNIGSESNSLIELPEQERLSEWDKIYEEEGALLY
jgi:carboxylesterase type B